LKPAPKLPVCRVPQGSCAGSVGAGAAGPALVARAPLRALAAGGPGHSPPRGAPLRLGAGLARLASLPGLFPRLADPHDAAGPPQKFHFRLPPTRGLVSSEPSSLEHLLSQPRGGEVAVIALGGPPESLEAQPGALRLQLLSRMGFVRIGLKFG
ncbi:2-acylglycerol O-acyltransferase 2-like, partial [Catharus ustulatus]|uniref:2-acylglycerol O-acyltransferase 2-like n=1 Tax=Catharus ustulatus TaxID=91951 RepID=UPI001C5AA3AF